MERECLLIITHSSIRPSLFGALEVFSRCFSANDSFVRYRLNLLQLRHYHIVMTDAILLPKPIHHLAFISNAISAMISLNIVRHHRNKLHGIPPMGIKFSSQQRTDYFHYCPNHKYSTFRILSFHYFNSRGR